MLPDEEALALAAANVILAEAQQAVEARGRFTVALAGGSTPEPIYRLLAAPPFSERMPWERIEVFWGDERCVDPADSRSNERMAREALLDHVPVSADRVHPMRCGGDAQRAARDYEAVLRTALGEAGGLDLVLLGLGADAHTASLFPGSRVLGETRRWVAAVQERAGAGTAAGDTGERLWRVTLTAPFINRAGLVLIVVSGVAKAPAAGMVLGGAGDPRELPALLIRPASERLWWLLDEAAASRTTLRLPAPER